MYKIKQVAEIFNCHENTIRNMIKDGRIKASKFGGEYRISEEEVKRLKGEVK